jgi:hypothetical protein
MSFIWNKPNWDKVENGVNSACVEWRKGNFGLARFQYESSAREYMKVASGVSNKTTKSALLFIGEQLESKAERCRLMTLSDTTDGFCSCSDESDVYCTVEEEETQIDHCIIKDEVIDTVHATFDKYHTFNMEVEDEVITGEILQEYFIVDEDDIESLKRRITQLEREIETERNKLKKFYVKQTTLFGNVKRAMEQLGMELNGGDGCNALSSRYNQMRNHISDLENALKKKWEKKNPR